MSGGKEVAGTYVTTRDISKNECCWLENDIQSGTTVYRYDGYTYGCVSAAGMACTFQPNETPFFELPRSSLTAKGQG